MPFHRRSQDVPLPNRLGAISFFTSITAAEAATLDPYTTWIVFSGDTIIAGGVTGATAGPPAVFSSVSNALAATLDAFTTWVVFAGDTKIAGGTTGSASGPPQLLNSGLYIPFAAMFDGGYGYRIDSGAGFITEDDAGLLIEMTEGSWEITLTGLEPTDGDHFILQALHLWLTVGAPTNPVDGDNIYFRSETSGANYSSVELYYTGGVWNIAAVRTQTGSPTRLLTDISAAGLAGTRIMGGQWASVGGVAAVTRTLVAEFYDDPTAGATAYSRAITLNFAVDDVSSKANEQTYRIGGSIGAGAAWTVRFHGLRGVEHVVNTLGTPF